jgi:putative nucleotidyltransferase with HDIG domain
VLPYAFAPLTLSVLLGKREALFALLFGSCWGAFLLNDFNSINIPFFLISLLTGCVAVITTRHVRRRSRLIRAGFYVGVTTWILALLLREIGPVSSPFTKSNGIIILLQSLGAVASGVGTAIIVSGLLPILEYLFSVTTDVSWLEMADLNHPLLRRLSLEAPGTYQHSIALATLAESAAEAIDANPTLCRVGAYFHDIGKLTKPEYFTENIASDFNPHDELTPTMSALIISAHVKEGIDLALKNKLHPRIVDIISQHHGTTMVGRFFERARQQQEDVRLGGKMMNMREEDVPDVCPESFRYPGPRPQTKEAVIISLADAAESATRSLEKPTRQRIADLIQSILKERLEQGEYNDCPITVGELHKIVETLVNTLQGMMHTRIDYKKDKP